MLFGVTSKIFFMICGRQAIRLTAGNKTVKIMNGAEGEKYSTFVPRLANKHD